MGECVVRFKLACRPLQHAVQNEGTSVAVVYLVTPFVDTNTVGPFEGNREKKREKTITGGRFGFHSNSETSIADLVLEMPPQKVKEGH